LRFATRAENLKPSDIREILKLTEDPAFISFAGGVPDPDYFPLKEMEEAVGRVMSNYGKKALQYNATEGHPPLREKIAARMSKAGMETAADNIIMVSGGQQGLDFSGKVFLNEGDAVVCESPTYAGAISAFKSYQPEFVEVATDREGMKIDQLERALATNGNIKMIYVIPDFQNPTGVSWSVERRRELLRLAHHYDVAVIEDDPYGELCFDREKKPTLRSLDTGGRVIYLGSFSKTLCPGLRVGWIEASPQVLQKYIIIKQMSDIHSNFLAQMQIDQYLEQNDFDSHIARVNYVYRARRDTMLQAVREYFPPGCSYTSPEGGLFIWVEMPEGADARKVLQDAIKEKMLFIPGETFYPCENVKNTFRLNFSNVKEERIEEGIKKLAGVLPGH